MVERPGSWDEMVGREAARANEEQDWRERHIIQEEKSEGFLARANRAIDKAQDDTVDWVANHAEAAAKKGMEPTDSPARRNAENIRYQAQGTPEAERLANEDLAKSLQQTGGEITHVAAAGVTRGGIEVVKIVVTDEAGKAVELVVDEATASRLLAREAGAGREARIVARESEAAGEAATSTGSARVGTTRHVKLDSADNGSYTVEFESGKGYAGKGGTPRARRSARQRSRLHEDPVRAIEHTPAATDEEAFRQEAERLEKLGGPESPNNYNQINSPGKKLNDK